MEIPITGFIIDSGDSGSSHAHKLYITSWNGTPVHVHAFQGETSYDDGHSHAYAGWTEAAPTGVPHVHEYAPVTSVANGHVHAIRGVTGPAVPLLGGGHYHYFEGYTTVNGSHPHAHAYQGRTGDEANP